jgi:hypothetical protein
VSPARRRLLGGPGALLALLAALAPARAEEPADPFAALQEELATLARWAEGKKAYGRRDEAYEAVLRLAPDDPEARKKLGFKREKGGDWERSSPYKRPVNWEKTAVAEFDRRRAEALATLRARVLEDPERLAGTNGLADAARALELVLALAPPETGPDAALRAAVLRVLALPKDPSSAAGRARFEDLARGALPEDEDVRRALGERRRDGRWILEESAASLERGDRLAEEARRAIEETPVPQPSPLTGTERRAGPAWSAAFETEHYRVVGTGAPEGLARIARSAQAARLWYPSPLGRPPPDAHRLCFLVLPKEEEFQAVLANWPAEEAVLGPQRPLLRLLGAVWLEREVVALRVLPSEVHELDMAVHIAFEDLAGAGFWADRSKMKAWAIDGLCLYLTWRLVGTRHSISVDSTYAAGAGGAHFDRRMEADWRRATGALQRVGGAPDLRSVLGKALDSFTFDDLLVSWTFAQWLLEARPEEAPRLLESLGRGTPIDEAFATTLGAPPEAVERRITRWIAEVAPP